MDSKIINDGILTDEFIIFVSIIERISVKNKNTKKKYILFKYICLYKKYIMNGINPIPTPKKGKQSKTEKRNAYENA